MEHNCFPLRIFQIRHNKLASRNKNVSKYCTIVFYQQWQWHLNYFCVKSSNIQRKPSPVSGISPSMLNAFSISTFIIKSYSNSTKRYFLNLKTQVSHSFLTPVQGKLETVSSKESLTKAHFQEIYMGDGEVC